jgi:hypothetical protein
MLLGQHHVDPGPRVRGDGHDRTLENFSLESLGPKDLTDLGSFSFGSDPNVTPLHLRQLRDLVAFCACAEVVARGHREAIGQKIGQAEDNDNVGLQTGADDAGSYRECRYRAIDPAVNPVTQIVRSIGSCQPGAYGCRIVFVL